MHFAHLSQDEQFAKHLFGGVEVIKLFTSQEIFKLLTIDASTLFMSACMSDSLRRLFFIIKNSSMYEVCFYIFLYLVTLLIINHCQEQLNKENPKSELDVDLGFFTNNNACHISRNIQ